MVKHINESTFNPEEAKELAARWSWVTGKIAFGSYDPKTRRTTLRSDGHILTRADIESATNKANASGQ